MKILWFINSLLPEMSAFVNGGAYNSVSASNSWVKALLEDIGKEVDLTIAMFYKGDCVKENKFDNYYGIAIPYKGNITKYQPRLNDSIKSVIDNVNPDVIHVHGTEYPYVYNILNVFDPNRIVISIQGIISEISKYYLGGLSSWDILSNITLRNIIFRDSVWGQKKEFERRGKFEILVFKQAKNVIGRTLWDKVHVKAINPDIHYYHLDEPLRNEFYDAPKWDYEKCRKNTVFVSQCTYPIKGLHILLKAIAILKTRYPNVRLRIAGREFVKRDSIIEKLKYSGYAKYISGLIKHLGLEDNIEFTGVLDAKGMVAEYLASNVYVCPSAIENSPNSMCEAQFLGVPSVLSFAGGIYDMTDFGNTANIYRFEDAEMLAYYVSQVFEDYHQEECRIAKAISISEKRHDKGVIVNELMNIYRRCQS